MEFTNDNLRKMRTKHKTYNIKYSNYFFRMSKEFFNKNFVNRSDDLRNCLNYWHWDLYQENKLLDLKTVNRCKSRFCPNCKLLDISRFIHKFRDIIDTNKEKYNFYFLTLTIPSCSPGDLEDTLKKLNKSFARLKEMYSYDKLTPTGKKSKKAYHNRLIDLAGGIRVLEITYNFTNGYHPHYHIFVMTEKPIPYDLLRKKHIARYSKKRKSVDLKSDLELQISRKWAEIWYDTKVSKKDYKPHNTYFNEELGYKILEVDFREFDEKGIYETIKYTFKDTDITTYEVFKTLYFSLYGKRMRQGFGVLYNLKIDDDELEVGEQQGLELEIAENPVDLITRGLTELLTTYKDYKKISRKHSQIDNSIKDE